MQTADINFKNLLKYLKGILVPYAFPFSLLKSLLPALVAQLVECPLLETGGHRFNPGPRHTSC